MARTAAAPARKKARISQATNSSASRHRDSRGAADTDTGSEDDLPAPNLASALRARKRGGGRKRRNSDEDEAEEDVDLENDGDGQNGGALGETTNSDPVSKLVRLALAMEYQKKPIRRQDITEKDFNHIFQEAQQALIQVFGFKLVELPAITEKISLAQQRRQAAEEAQRGAAEEGSGRKSAAAPKGKGKGSSGSKSWHVISCLPAQYMIGDVLAPVLPDDRTLLGVSMTILTLVYLSGRSLNETTLKRHLRKLGIEERVLVEGNKESGKMENILGKMVKEGYLVKLKDEVVPGQDQSHTYVVGPRGKLEIGRGGVEEFVKQIYQGVDGEIDDGFDRKINRAIGKEDLANEAGESNPEAGEPKNKRRTGNARKGQRGRGNNRGRVDLSDDEDEAELSSDED